MFGRFFGKEKLKPLNKKHIKMLDESVNWIYLNAIKELRDNGYEHSPLNMSSEIKSAMIQYLFGVTLALEEDLKDTHQISDWAMDSRSKVLSLFLQDKDIDRAKLEYSRMLGKTEEHFACFLVGGANACRDFLSSKDKGQSPTVWLESYEGMFMASIRLFTSAN
ncbi:hypothetical protein [Vibrio hepatarius]|uniref:hypothetical protein n=1 Tax=Vibrio hepatarius TaxID=171383 RepID=UPI003736DEFD